MSKKALAKKIKRRKKVLNFMLLFFSPTNKLMVFLSQNLDEHVSKYQLILARRSIIHRRPVYYEKLSA